MAKVLTWEVDFGRGVDARLKRTYADTGCWYAGRTKEQAIASHLELRKLKVREARDKRDRIQAELTEAEYRLAKDCESLGVPCPVVEE